MRRLEVTVSGKWFLALTIALGVVGLISGNNVLYLIESLLLSGLILSGVLSERTISGLQIEIRRFPASALGRCRDELVVRNTERYPLFCVEVGEWKNKKLCPAAFIPRLSAKSSAVIPSRQTFDQRGKHAWEGIAIATSYPFGFARKIKVLPLGGDRIIWPELLESAKGRRQGLRDDRGANHGQDFAEGEIRQYTQDDDSRLIVWTHSARGLDPMVRVRKTQTENPEVTLDLRIEPGQIFEEQVKRAAQPFHHQSEAGRAGTLIIIDWKGKRRLSGREQVLTSLALAQAVGEKNPAKGGVG